MNKRRTLDDGPEPNIPVTPMLDMAFQLLAFFVLTYHPSDLEGQMQLALPTENTPAAHKLADVDPKAKPDPDITKEMPADLTVTAKTQTNGTLSEIAISALSIERASIHPASSEAKRVNEALNALTHELQKIKKELEKTAAVQLVADSKLKWDSVTLVMDACRKAGFENISLSVKDTSQSAP
jgi:biopolymer transport protein ExbD